MTMFGFILGLSWAGVCFWLGNRLLDHLEIHSERESEDRRLFLDRMQVEGVPGRTAVIGEAFGPSPRRSQIQIPDDLEALALRESEDWAQNDFRTLVKEKFLELHDGDTASTWQKVRRAMGIGEMP